LAGRLGGGRDQRADGIAAGHEGARPLVPGTLASVPMPIVANGSSPAKPEGVIPRCHGRTLEGGALDALVAPIAISGLIHPCQVLPVHAGTGVHRARAGLFICCAPAVRIDIPMEFNRVAQIDGGILTGLPGGIAYGPAPGPRGCRQQGASQGYPQQKVRSAAR